MIGWQIIDGSWIVKDSLIFYESGGIGGHFMMNYVVKESHGMDGKYIVQVRQYNGW